jgi:hypothetical protein
MSENTTSKTTSYMEAPASWNTKYLSSEGFVCQITLRADSGRELLEKAQLAIAHLIETGCTPCETLAFRPKNNGNGNGHKPTSASEPAHVTNSAPSTNSNNGNGNALLCSIHNVEMRRFEKNGQVWFSHKTEDGIWCSGKSK